MSRISPRPGRSRAVHPPAKRDVARSATPHPRRRASRDASARPVPALSERDTSCFAVMLWRFRAAQRCALHELFVGAEASPITQPHRGASAVDKVAAVDKWTSRASLFSREHQPERRRGLPTSPPPLVSRPLRGRLRPAPQARLLISFWREKRAKPASASSRLRLLGREELRRIGLEGGETEALGIL